MLFETTISTDEQDIPITVHYSRLRAVRGYTDGRFGPRLTPDDPAGIEVDQIELPPGVELTDSQLETLEQQIAELEDG